MAQEVDISFWSGNTVKIKVTVDDDDNPSNPKDLTGASDITWILAKQQGYAPKITKTLGSGCTIIDALNGRVDVDLSKTDTEPYKGEMYHEMRVTDATGQTATVMYGKATVEHNSITT